MKNFYRKFFIKFISIFILLFAFLASSTYAIPLPNEMTIINHFDNTLAFEIVFNQEVLPDLPQQFVLLENGQTSSRVINNNKKALVRVMDNQGNTATWSVEFKNNQIRFFSIESDGIAFITGPKTITFNTPGLHKDKKGSY